MSDPVYVRISQYGVIPDAEVTGEQLMNDAEGLADLAQELHRDAIWACLQRIGSDAALPWRQILSNLEDARDQLYGPPAVLPSEAADLSESAAISLASLEGASC